MSSMTTGWIVLACVFGGALIGALLRKTLPDHHLSSESKDCREVWDQEDRTRTEQYLVKRSRHA
jgi:hypothetical protein